jgi:hypothetical protein
MDASARVSPMHVALTVVVYVLTTLAVQGGSHFLVNADHYAAMTIMRAQPIIAMGIGSMIVQGIIFALLFPTFNRGGRPVRNGLLFSWALGGFLASYIVLGEAGKYAIPSIPSWIAIEASVAFVQYTAFGVFLGLLHRKTAPAAAPQIT